MAGLIYRNYRPVHYSPSSHSALAEAELIYREDHVSHSVYVSFVIDHTKAESMSVALREILAQETSAQLLVWTTTPWTLTANMVRSRTILTDSRLTLLALGDCCPSRDVICSCETKIYNHTMCHYRCKGTASRNDESHRFR